jgi:parallel beta-helix repeat protein
VLSQPSVTWLKQPVPYIIEDRHLEIYSDAGSMLTIQPGTTIKTSGNIIWVGAYGKGGLIANGTASEPIIFSSSRATPQKGDWNGIRFTSQTLSGSMLNHCVVEYAGYYSDAGVTVSYTDLPSITNSTIRYSASYGIELEMSNPTMSNNTFVGNDGVDVY